MILGLYPIQRYCIRMDFLRIRQACFTADSRLLKTLALSGVACLAALAALSFDLAVARSFVADSLPGDLRRVLSLCEIFAHGVGVALIGWCLWHLSPPHRRFLPRLISCALLPGLAANLLKLSFCRLRPIYFGEQVPSSIDETWIATLPSVFSTRADFGTYAVTSFPSGHAATAFGLAIGLSWLFPAGRAPFYTMAVLATIQRVASGAHWLSDALVGLALAIFIAGSLTSQVRLARAFARFESRESANPSAPESSRAA